MKTLQIAHIMLGGVLLWSHCQTGQPIGQDLTQLDESGSHIRQPDQPRPQPPPSSSQPSVSPGLHSTKNSQSDTIQQDAACKFEYFAQAPNELESQKTEEDLLNTKFTRDHRGDAIFETMASLQKNKKASFPAVLSGLFSKNTPVVVLYLWSPKCTYCLAETKKLATYSQNLAQIKGVRVAFITETSNHPTLSSNVDDPNRQNNEIESWQSFMKKPTFKLPKGIFQGIIRDEPTCIQLASDPARPLLVALSKRTISETRTEEKAGRPIQVSSDTVEFVVRQALQPPFTKARIDHFRSGIQNLMKPGGKFIWPAPPKPGMAEEERLRVDRVVESKLLHQKLSSVVGKPIKLTPGPLFYMVRLGPSAEKTTDEEKTEAKLLSDEIDEINKVQAQKNPSGSMKLMYLPIPYSAKFTPYGGMQITLLVDTKTGTIRKALVGPLVSRGRFVQGISDGIRNLLQVLPENVSSKK